MGRSIQTGRTTPTFDYMFRMLIAARRLRDPSISVIRANYMDLRASGQVPSLWILVRPFILQSIDLPEVQINNIQTRAGQPKVPFSWCRWHLLGFHYRWGSMGPNETASRLIGGPRVIGVFDVRGCHRIQIKHFFGMQ